MVTAKELLEQYSKKKPFYSNGGITVTGGEPLLQIDFITDLFTKAKADGIHTCIDTSGITFRENSPELVKKFDTLMAVTDLVLLDIKHIDCASHEELTGMKNDNVLSFARYLAKKHVPVWIRHVIVPGITDDEEEWKALGRFLATLSNLKALDVLPYHTMGVKKYEALGIDYPLDGVPALEKSEAARARTVILEAFKEALAERKRESNK